MSELEKIMAAVPSGFEIRFAASEVNPADSTGMGTPLSATVVLAFSSPGFGFGEFTLKQDADGRLYVNTEHTSPEKIVALVADWLKSAVTEYDADPERHAQWKRVMGARCGPGCPACHGTSER